MTGSRSRSIVDAQTGEDLPATFQGLNTGRFLSDCTTLLAVGDQLKVMGIDGKVIKTYPLPEELASQSVQMLTVN